MQFTQDENLAQLHTQLGKDKLLLKEFTCSECVSSPFELRCAALTTQPDLSVERLLGRPVAISVNLDHDKLQEPRWFHGVVRHICDAERASPFYVHELTVVPRLWFLSLTKDSRVFQRKTTQEIVESVLRRHGIRTAKWRIDAGSYARRRYCVQYQESDLNFVSRLLEEEGIHYYFEHAADGHTIVFSDQPTCEPCPLIDRVRFQYKRTGEQREHSVLSIVRDATVQSSAVVLQDYDFKKPVTNLLADAGEPDTPSEWFEFPGRYFTRSDGERLAKVRLQEIESNSVLFRGSSECRTFACGFQFTLSDHYSDHMNQSFRLIEVKHMLKNSTYQADSTETRLPTAHSESFYSNDFVAVRAPGPYRPKRVAPRPVIEGTQSAVVVGPKGREIHTDKYGRVKIQFHWDRREKYDDNSSCWIRVCQPWAGKGWGSVAIPRIGQEVLVSFLDGDPDRPVVVGRLYNDAMMPPYPLPAKANLMGFKSKSVHGGGYNEIAIDDTNATEEIRIHAQYNMNERVEHDHGMFVGNNRTEEVAVDESITIGNNRTEHVGVNESITIGSNRTEKVGANEKVSIGSNRNVSVGSNEMQTIGLTRTHSIGINDMLNVGAAQEISVGGIRIVTVGISQMVNVGMKHSLNAGNQITLSSKKIMLEATEDLTIKCGAGTININAAGVITIQGPLVKINS